MLRLACACTDFTSVDVETGAVRTSRLEDWNLWRFILLLVEVADYHVEVITVFIFLGSARCDLLHIFKFK